jgi:hypothetical protein
MSLEVLHPLKLLHSRVWYINRLDCNLYDEIHTFNDLKRDVKAALVTSKLLRRLMVCSYKNNIETTSSYSCAGTLTIDTVTSRQMIALDHMPILFKVSSPGHLISHCLIALNLLVVLRLSPFFRPLPVTLKISPPFLVSVCANPVKRTTHLVELVP